MSASKYIALDIGAVSVKAAVFDDSGDIIHLRSERIEGNLPDCLKTMLIDLGRMFRSCDCSVNAVTGSGAGSLADLMGVDAVDEITAAYLGGVHLVPEAGSILSVGGFRSCFIQLMDDPATGRRVPKKSVHNSRCSSGSGVFFEQEAGRCNLSLDRMMDLAREASHPPIISGRCTVFARTDIIHRHQNGVGLRDIAGAVCQMIARNIAGELVKNAAYDIPIAFIGGVAQNSAVRAMLRDILGLDDQALVVPPRCLYAGAIGAWLDCVSHGRKTSRRLGYVINLVDDAYRVKTHSVRRLKPLERSDKPHSHIENVVDQNNGPDGYLLGIDIGSTNTKVVCVGRSGTVLESYSTPTRGQPLDAVREAFARMVTTGNGGCPRAVGVTGSGRKYISDVIQGDIAVNEITAHAEAAISFDPAIDTVIDIGGQDSKFIRIQNGRVVQFEMNKVCSAGTGSFLEETAGFLGLDVREEFAGRAFEARAPLDLGDRCTVFMNSELAQRQNQGFLISDIAAGLAYSVINNYVSRVVGRHAIGQNISFQGGVAGNRAVVAALESVLNRQVFVHPHHEIAGALGAAIVAGRETKQPSRFAGYTSINRITLNHESFQCRKCGNCCSVNYVRTDDDRRLYFGGICDRYDEKSVKSKTDDTSPLAVRQQLLEHNSRKSENEITGDTIGLPLAMHFTELLPFWTTFLNSLGLRFVVSPPTTREIMRIGSDISPSSSCLPLKIAYGHCMYLRQIGIKKLFMPSIGNISFNTRAERLNHICPAAQAWPYTTASLLRDNIDIIDPTIRMALPHTFRSDILSFGKSLGYGKHQVADALAAALKAQHDTYDALRIIDVGIGDDSNDTPAILFARPYTFTDYQIFSRLQPILNDLGVTAIPFDMLPATPRYSHDLDGMYWYYGKRYLQAARSMKSIKNPVGIFISTYGCGTDTLLIHLLRDALGDIPFLELEIDQHCDFTGLRTRLEAFFYSLRKNRRFNISSVRRHKNSPMDLRGRRIVIPRMSDHAVVCASALHSFGYEAEVMPLTGDQAMSCGKNIVNGGECLPCTMLAGDMLNYLNNNDGRDLPAFFMISGDGPCRLGQYTYLLRKILDEKGHEQVPIVDMSQDISFYTRMDIVSSEFKKRLWKGSVAVDLLHSRYRELRSVAVDRDRLDSLYREAVDSISHSVHTDGELVEQLRLAFDEFDKCPIIEKKPELAIALIGENYIRCNTAANQRIVAKLESMNAAVYVPQLTEWIYYTNWTARLHCRYERRFARYCKMFLIDSLQKLYSYRLRNAVGNRLSEMSEPHVRRIFRLASPYVPSAFEGETIISIGRTIDYCLKGVDGVIQVAPFGCLAGTIYETISQKLSDDLGGFPILNLQFDGRNDDLRQDELSSFLIMSRNWKERKEGRR